MKNLKTTIGLSVLALACLGAGALNLQPNVSAKAEETTETVTTLENSRLRTYFGAEICVSDDFSGIRWKSRTPKGFPYVDADGNFMDVQGATETNGATATNGVGAQFGVLVAPTGSFGEELTIADVSEDGAMNLAYAESALDTSKGATYFYTVINYDELGAEFKQEAYALNLTARAYMLFKGQYYYALQEDNSRSARQIAITNEVDGTLDKFRASENADKVAFAAKATEYYGGGVATYDKDTSKHFIDDTVTTVVDMEAFATNGSVDVTIDLGEANFVEAVVGTEKVNATYADGKLTITDFGSVADGEHYVTVFTSNGFIYKPMITATKVITAAVTTETANGLDMFQTKGKVTAWTKVSGWTDGKADASQIYKGYYVLGGNINATDYVHGTRLEGGSAFNDSTWNGMANYEGKDFGLMGAFNGMGYTIDGLTMGNTREGIFGFVNGGAVKNVGFTNFKTSTSNGAYTNVIANYLLDATVDNVYISTAENFVFGTGSGLIASTAYGETVISNCYINVNTSSANAGAALFGGSHKNEAYTCENVYVNVVTTQASTYILGTVDGETTKYALSTLEIFPMGLAQGKVKSGKVDTKGTVYFAQNQTAPTELTTTAYAIKTITGVYAYTSIDTWGTHEYDKFLATGCWTASDRGVAWVVKGAQE